MAEYDFFDITGLSFDPAEKAAEESESRSLEQRWKSAS